MSAPRRSRPGAAPRWSSDLVHDVVYFQRHHDDDPSEASPGHQVLHSWPLSVQAKAIARLAHVAAAPPKRVRGGGYWEAMSGDMTGWHEIRVDGSNRHHYRLFCIVDNAALNCDRPFIAVIDGRDKAFRTVLAEQDYDDIRRLGDEYRSRNPRSLKSSS
jgi:hypothetical protein